MKHSKIRITALALALFTVLSSFALFSCATDPGSKPVDPAGSGTGAAPDTTANPNVCPVPEQDYGDYDFNVLEGGFGLVVFRNDFAYDDSAASTVLDDAVFRRNSAAEERLSIRIVTDQKICRSTTGSEEGYGTLMKEKRAGDTNYDAAVLPAYDQTKLAYLDALTDMNKVSTLDFSNKWWDQKAVNTLTIKDMLFFATGDYSIDVFNSTIVILFNKAIAAEKKVEDLYKLVEEGKWTFAKWKEYTSQVSTDLNGDDLFTDKDLYGAAVWDDAVYAVVHSSGERCCDLDENGNMVLTLGTERAISAYTDYVEFALKDRSVIRYQQTFGENGKASFNAGSDLEYKLFQNDQALFLFTWLGVADKFRDMDTDYGILPVFKYTEDQQEYYNTVAPYNARFLSMPYLQEDEERTGTILETIGFYSGQMIIPAFYEKTLYGATVRDEESRPMLELIREHRVFDLGYFYQPANINKELILLFRANQTNWASRYQALEKSAKTILDRFNKAFDGIRAGS